MQAGKRVKVRMSPGRWGAAMIIDQEQEDGNDPPLAHTTPPLPVGDVYLLTYLLTTVSGSDGSAAPGPAVTQVAFEYNCTRLRPPVCELSHVNKVDTVWVSSRSRGPKGYPAVSIPSVSPSPPPPPAQRRFPQRAPRERAVAGSARRSRNPRTIAASLCRRTAARP